MSTLANDTAGLVAAEVVVQICEPKSILQIEYVVWNGQNLRLMQKFLPSYQLKTHDGSTLDISPPFAGATYIRRGQVLMRFPDGHEQQLSPETFREKYISVEPRNSTDQSESS